MFYSWLISFYLVLSPTKYVSGICSESLDWVRAIDPEGDPLAWPVITDDTGATSSKPFPMSMFGNKIF